VFGIGALSTLRSWLSMWSLETSQCTAAPHLARITVASLVVQAIADAGVCESGVCAIFSALAATDRGLALLGADQHFTEPAGARVQLAELIAGWLGEHAA